MECSDVSVKTLLLHAPMLQTMDEAVLHDTLVASIDFAPSCLPEAKQKEAVYYYAAYLLSLRQQAELVGVIPAGVTSEKEGDLSRSYGNNGSNSADPYGFLARYEKLNNVCKRVGAITVGTGAIGGCCGCL